MGGSEEAAFDASVDYAGGSAAESDGDPDPDAQAASSAATTIKVPMIRCMLLSSVGASAAACGPALGSG